MKERIRAEVVLTLLVIVLNGMFLGLGWWVNEQGKQLGTLNGDVIALREDFGRQRQENDDMHARASLIEKRLKLAEARLWKARQDVLALRKEVFGE